ncbi:helix-turn-helix domain-containing protein [Sphingomonas sp. SRS2]|uniref:helix-turn-helix domain-containing protein n=1 Tax=Sphingomonas sp. SRS2 TaxID=133190 RepID=UPI0006184503|nr:helix-turn-helix domain-containing protein [Sphingomonas sp. SRS2]KKC24266.1 XRE family transcriptional regulator [Sphingomonas sp. SRS2]
MIQLARSPKQLGMLIQNARRRHNLTQQALASLVGTGQKTVSRIESGHAGTKLETLFSLLGALDLDIQIGPRRKGDADLGEIF